MSKKRKGMSPLISSILLIGFAAALGMVVMSWGKSVAATGGTIGSCEDTSLSIIGLDQQPQACLAESEIELTVENTGKTPINGLKISFIGADIEQIDIEREIAVGEITKVFVPIDKASPFQKVKVTPRIPVKKDSQFCPLQGMETQSIGACP